jgi:hypothetical protein
MKTRIRSAIVLALVMLGFAAAPAPVRSAPDKEFLTPKEIEKIQDAQEIDQRVKIYLDAAALRLRTAEERLGGKESEPGDPLELFSVEEMVDGYYRILKSVMLNLDDAYQKRDTDKNMLGKALKNLRDSTEWAEKVLLALKKSAEEKRNEELWNLVNQSIDISKGAHEGAELGLSKNPAPAEKRKTKSKDKG